MAKANALIIYAKEDIEKNKWFIDRLTKYFQERNIELILKTPEDHKSETGVCFVINRSRDKNVSLYYEAKRIRCFNNSRTTGIGNNKLASCGMFKELGIDCMETVPGTVQKSEIPFKYPFIVKEKYGHGGSGVFKACTPAELEKITAGYDLKDLIFQEMCDEPGVDMRVYVLGGKIFASVLRTSDNDFRSNFSLGGKAVLCEPDEKQIENINDICRILEPDYIGVDFIRHKGRWVVNEIEDAAGARMLYLASEKDIAGAFADYIYEKTFQK